MAKVKKQYVDDGNGNKELFYPATISDAVKFPDNSETLTERFSHFSKEENDEFLAVETDADGKILATTYPDGSHYAHNLKSETIDELADGKVDKVDGKSLIDEGVAAAKSVIEDSEDRYEITTDEENRILSYRDSKGVKRESSLQVDGISIEHFTSLSESSCKELMTSLAAYGLTMENKLDFSDNTDMFLATPRGVAVVNIIADSLATSKTQNKDAILEFWGSGIYFRKNIILNAQGQTSMHYAKKNQAIEFTDGTSIKFGDWVAQDSFHLKANADDVFCGLIDIIYKYTDYVVEKTDTRANRVLRSTTTTYKNASGNITADFDDGAKCVPDGFPISLHLNGEFYGMYTWNLKKHRDNYSMNKKDYKSILIDPLGMTADKFWGGTIDWTVFEIRNPKTLICMDGSKYDGDNPKELIDETSENYDATNKDMKNTATTKSLIVALSKAMSEIDSQETDAAKREKYKEFFDFDNFAVFYLLGNAIGHCDGLWGKNTLITVYNGGKCGVNMYDCNGTLGRSVYGPYYVSPDRPLLGSEGTPWEMNTLFHDELSALYKKLRDEKLISSDTICGFLKEWISNIGLYSIKKNMEKWKDIASYREDGTYDTYPTTGGSYDSIERCRKWLDARIAFMDSKFGYNV